MANPASTNSKTETITKQSHIYQKMLERDKKMVSYMVAIYCRDHHHTNNLCADCDQIKGLIFNHLTRCPFQEKKTACGRCNLQCYPSETKGKVMEVMSYAGPRMAVHHPILAFHHLWDGRRPARKLTDIRGQS